MKMNRAAQIAVLLGAALAFLGCGHPTVVPFQPEKTRVVIAASPKVIADTLATDFLLPALNVGRSLSGQPPVAGPLSEVLETWGLGQEVTMDDSAIHLRVMVVNKAKSIGGGESFYDFPYSAAPGGVSMVCNGMGVQFGNVKQVASVSSGQDLEQKLRQILLDVKAKAESQMKAKN